MSRLRVQIEGSRPWNPILISEAMEELFPKVEFLSFDEAREFVRKLRLKNKTKWLEYFKSSKRPLNIPSNPDKFYKNRGWVSFGDFLGTGYICNKDRVYLPFEEARAFVRKLKLKDTVEWWEYLKSSERPLNIPSKPERTYKDKGWVNLGNWLGTGFVHCSYRIFISYTDARKIVRKLDFKSSEEWNNYCKSGKRPKNIPSNPSKTYKNKGWISWSDFLGIVSKKTEKQHIKFMKKNNIINSNQWIDYRKGDNFQGQGYLTNPWRTFGKTAKQFFVEIRN